MAKVQKLLERMRDNPRNWRIDDIKALADRHGIEYRQHGTSHVTFRAPGGAVLPIPAARPIAPVYVRQFVALIDSLEEAE
jgi:hypothetical protein